jgi:hypothetical protein
MAEEKLVAVYRAGNSIEGNFLQGLLAKDGIPVTLLADGNPKGSREVELQVPADKVDAARLVLRRYEADSEADAAPAAQAWTCRRCGEENESSFEACWNCQAEFGHA